MKKMYKWLLFVLVICLLATPVLAATGGIQQTLFYRDIKISVDGDTITPTDVNGKTVEPFIIDGTTYLPVRAISEALNCDVDWDGSTNTVSISTGEEITLKAGAGTADIVFKQAMFPVEGFNGVVNDDPAARVLVVKNNEKVAIVSLEMVNVPSDVVEICKDVVNAATGTAKENIWVHATHAITTPHAPSDAAQRELFVESITEAVTAAAKEAAETYQDAVMGVGTGYCDVNANRDIELNGKWYYGKGSTMTSNKTMTILRFDSLDGDPIGLFVSYGIKPTCIDNAEMAAGTRQISADVPGVACDLLEEKYGVTAMFCMPAAGDQIPKDVAMFYELNEQGEAAVTELSVADAIVIMEKQGKEMADAAVSIVDSIACKDNDPVIASTATSFNWANKAGDGEITVDVSGIQLSEDVALVGLKPETNAITELQLWDASPYKHTLIVSFLNGDQKYMPDAEAYTLETWEFKRAGGAVGCAEEFVRVATNMLEDLHAGKTSGGTGSGTGTGGSTTGQFKTIEFGGKSWYVLDVKDGKTLVLSKNVLETRAYKAAGGAVTWETSDLRSYLNGAFYNTFTAAEKAQIVSTTIENKSNSKYGIAGGNSTTDNVFLLSLDEVETYLVGFTDVLNAKDLSGNAAWWHLRSPGEATDVAACVSATGLIDYHGVSGGVSDATGGVRPAMWVELG